MQPEASRARSVRRVLLLTLGCNLLVAAGKISYGHLTNTLAIRADGFHSLTDGTNNLVGLVGVHLGSRPADEDHPYGHAKFEIVAAGLIGLSLLAMSYDVLKSALSRFGGSASAPDLDWRGFVVLGITLAVNSWVAVYEKRMGERLNSAFLLSDATHTRSDVLVTIGVFVTVVLIQLGYPIFDTLSAGLIAAFIAWAGIGVLRGNLRHLADARALDPAVIESVVARVPGVASSHKIRTRGPHGSIHVDLHVQIARHLDVVEAHRVTHWVIEAIKREIPGVTDVLVHTEPARVDQSYNPLPGEDRPAS